MVLQLLTELFDSYERFSEPSKHGARYYFAHNTGLLPQSRLYSQSELDGEPKLFMDPNVLPPGEPATGIASACCFQRM